MVNNISGEAVQHYKYYPIDTTPLLGIVKTD